MYKKNDVIKILTMKPFWSDQDKLCTIRAVISAVFALAWQTLYKNYASILCVYSVR